jgi:hypothetical protein
LTGPGGDGPVRIEVEVRRDADGRLTGTVDAEGGAVAFFGVLELVARIEDEVDQKPRPD